MPSAYEAALDLYPGELLPENCYQGWADGRRRELQETYLSLLLGLAYSHEERGDYGSAVEALRRVLSEGPLREDAHMRLMRLYALSGRKSEALKQYDALRETTSRELCIEPSATSRAFREEIASGRFPPPGQPFAVAVGETSGPPPDAVWWAR